MSTPPRRLTQSLVVKIYELIKPRIRKADNGLWEYDQDWSDTRVSDIMKADGVTPSNVARVRNKLFGGIALPKNPRREAHTDQLAAVMASLIRLEAKLDHLTREVGSRPWEGRLGGALGASNGPFAPESGSSQER